MTGVFRSCVCAALLCIVIATAVGAEPEVKQALFERVFGEYARLDPATVAKVKALKPGGRLLVDRNGDGKNDEVWYIDTAARHEAKAKPLLVRAIDEDGDLDAWKGPDLDSDLYIADWGADGTADVVLDYQDDDGDNDVDSMGMYFFLAKHRYFGENTVMVWWGRDDGDDNRLWYDVNYTYDQRRCQYRCHFSGEETIVAFGLREGDKEWQAAFENPFLFYDPDEDLCSEVVLRIEGKGDKIYAARYSFDADDDAYGRRTHDYEFSITAVAEPDKMIALPPELTESTKLRGIPTQRWLRRDKAREFTENAAWSRVLLTWDEINANTEQDVQGDPHERWEGVIAQGNDRFPQVGGPPCSRLNKRNELALNPAGPLQLYYDPSDRRIHLKGASEGWLHADYDLDGKVDAKYAWSDEDKDGVFDRRTIDVDGDGKDEFVWNSDPKQCPDVPLDFRSLREVQKKALSETLAGSQAFIDAVRGLFAARKGEELADPVETFFCTKIEAWEPRTSLGAYVRKSPAGARFYTDLVRDRRLHVLRQEAGSNQEVGRVEAACARGAYAEAARVVRESLTTSASPVTPDPKRLPTVVSSFTRRLPLDLRCKSGSPRPPWPVAVRIADIRKIASDFNPDNCAVVAPERWLDWREVPHQVDASDPVMGLQISFVIDSAETASAPWWIYYSPTGKRETTFAHRTSTAEDWVPPNIGWESNRCAYRAYWGQFDFFGKKTEQLVYENIEKKSYHSEVEWGIDALHVGNASGLGGLTLHIGDKAYLVQNPSGKGNVEFTKRQICKGPVRAAIEIVAKNVVPEKPGLSVWIQCVSYAERQESEVRARVTGADAPVLLAPGLVKLPREQAFARPEKGFIGSWGWQEDVIGDVGMAVITAPACVVDVVDLPEERRMRCRLDDEGELRYWIIGDWRRGRQHPVAPTVTDWEKEVESLAERLVDTVRASIGPAGDVR